MRSTGRTFLYFLVLLLACCSPSVSQKKELLQESVKSALRLTNNNHVYEFYPDLNDAEIEPIGGRLRVYSNKNDWAIVYEIVAFSLRDGDIANFSYYFGSNLKNMEEPIAGYTDNYTNLYKKSLLSLDDLRLITDDRFFLLSSCDSLLISGEKWKIEKHAETYKNSGVPLDMFGLVSSESLPITAACRLLFSKNRDLFLLDDKEITAHVPESLPKVLELYEWHHENVAHSKITQWQGVFSDAESDGGELVEMLARVVSTGDPDSYLPVEKKNTVWSSWIKEK